MLDYLITSETRRRLLRLLWSGAAEGSVRSLAARAGTSFAAAHRELTAMNHAGLATSVRIGSATVYRAERSHPLGDHLAALLAAPDRRLADEPEAERIRSRLAALGAPLAVERVAPDVDHPEDAVAAGLALAHDDPSVARALPVCLWRQRHRLDWAALVAAARSRDHVQTLGFFTDLTGTLAGDRAMVQRGRALLDRRRRKPRPFFTGPRTSRRLAAAERNTPAVARRWHFRMNMGLDAFQSLFDKWVTDAPVRA